MANLTLKDELFQFYKESYYHEIGRKDEIRKQLGLAIAVLALLGNSAYYYLSKFQFFPFSFAHLGFYVPFLLGILSSLIAFFFLLRYMFEEREYAYIPTTEDIREVIDKFEKANQTESDENDVRNFYIQNLSKRYSKAATRNQLNNDKRTGYVFSSLRASLISILLFLAAFPCFFIFFTLHDRLPADEY